jgi:hypothetical protein
VGRGLLRPGSGSEKQLVDLVPALILGEWHGGGDRWFARASIGRRRRLSSAGRTRPAAKGRRGSLQRRSERLEKTPVDPTGIERAALKALEVPSELPHMSDVDVEVGRKLTNDVRDAEASLDSQLAKRRLTREPGPHQCHGDLIRSRRRCPLEEPVDHLRERVSVIARAVEVHNRIRLLTAGVLDGVLVKEVEE